MLNLQPIEKLVSRPDGALDIVNVWETVQGEGPLVGSPAIFVRLAGCDLNCPACDTDYTSNRKLRSLPDLVELVRRCISSAMRGPGLVVLTGGEPLRQNVEPFVCALLSKGHTVQIETNGTYYQKLPFSHERFLIVCSPKAGINKELRPFITAYKYVVQAGQIDSQDGLPLTTLGNACGVARPDGNNKAVIYVQPLDEGHTTVNERNTKAAIESCLKYGYRLCLQMHKIVGLP